MNNRFEELKRKSELNNNNIFDLYSEIVDAYQKGEIDCNDYLTLYDTLGSKKIMSDAKP